MARARTCPSIGRPWPSSQMNLGLVMEDGRPVRTGREGPVPPLAGDPGGARGPVPRRPRPQAGGGRRDAQPGQPAGTDVRRRSVRSPSTAAPSADRRRPRRPRRARPARRALAFARAAADRQEGERAARRAVALHGGWPTSSRRCPSIACPWATASTPSSSSARPTPRTPAVARWRSTRA